MADEQDTPASVSIISYSQEGGNACAVQQPQISKVHFNRAERVIQRPAENLVQVVGH